MYRLLDIRCLRTTPYHPQCSGLVERFNQILKALLRKSATKDGKDWDKLLPYLLFAYREAPQESTDFPPLNSFMGKVSEVLNETWEAREKTDESVMSYLMLMRERLEKMTQLAQTNKSQGTTGAEDVVR